jgi:type I restriction enzyme M protein
MTEYKKTKASAPPSKPPEEFCIYEVDDDQYVFCPIRKREYKVNAKPEEIVRQWWLYRLKEVYGYGFDQIAVEVSVKVGSTEAKKKADIVVYSDTKRLTPRIFIEVKKPKRKDGIDQLKVYLNATGCRIGVWSNGTPPHVYLLRIEPREGGEETNWRELRNIPAKSEQLGDVDTAIIRKELEPVKDFLSILRECEDYIKAHEGANVFEEIFKLVFAKLYDEKTNLRNDNSPAQFRVGVFEAPEEARARIASLFKKATERWSGVFQKSEELTLTDESLTFSVSALQKAYLLKSPADVLGSAFEVMINPGMKGDKGQYFTPRHVVKLCIDILAPKDGQTIFDPACGSGGFLIGAIEHVYKQIEEERDNPSEIVDNKKDYAAQCVFGMDYDHTIAKVAKAYMLIWGDGRSNIAVCDALNEGNWSTEIQSKFMTGKGTVSKLRRFDIIATNPPFAGDLEAEETLARYDLAHKPLKGGGRKRLSSVARDKLFIERCLRMLNPNGRMVIVVPRGTLKNYNDEYVRRFILREARVLAVIGLSGEMFKPFTNTKTCLLFLQKREHPLTELDEAQSDRKLVFAVTEQPGKDRSGNLVLDTNGNIVSDLPKIAAFVRQHIRFAD